MQNQQTCDTGFNSEIPLRMLKLNLEAVAENWNIIKGPIEESLPPITTPSEQADRMTRILESLLAGILECHIFFKVINGVTFVYGLTVLAKVRNVEGSRDHLLIYAAWGHTKYLFENGLSQCLALVRKYAIGQGCSAIFAYSNIPHIIRTIKEAGGSSDYRLLMLEV